MRSHSDWTSDKAVGAADREWRQMAKLALRIRSGNKNPMWIDEQEKKFTGIFKRLLTDPIEEIEKEIIRSRQK